MRRMFRVTVKVEGREPVTYDVEAAFHDDGYEEGAQHRAMFAMWHDEEDRGVHVPLKGEHVDYEVEVLDA